MYAIRRDKTQSDESVQRLNSEAYQQSDEIVQLVNSEVKQQLKEMMLEEVASFREEIRTYWAMTQNLQERVTKLENEVQGEPLYSNLQERVTKLENKVQGVPLYPNLEGRITRLQNEVQLLRNRKEQDFGGADDQDDEIQTAQQMHGGLNKFAHHGEYRPLHRHLAPVLISAEGQADHTEMHPESMYNYCMQCFAASSNVWRDPALRWWMLLFTLQAIVIHGFAVVNDLSTLVAGVMPPDQRGQVINNCMLKTKFYGVPLMQWCIGYAAIVMITSIMRVDDESSFRAPFPEVGSGALQWLVRFAWFWQTTYIPAVYTVQVAQLLARSGDAMEVVMNTLAVSFIMDIDEMLYEDLLSDAQKLAYQRGAGVPIAEFTLASGQCSWAVSVVNTLTMASVFTFLLATIGSAKMHGRDFEGVYEWIGVVFVLTSYLRVFLQHFFTKSRHESSISTRCSSTFLGSLWAGTAAACCGYVLFALAHVLTGFEWVGDSELLACNQIRQNT